ncbi:MAG: XRE family transcriptional regulator [Gammaproteobacteria bacterium]|nr:XRE family transcriptional regulator [Gammaproteobacteria bacterium]
MAKSVFYQLYENPQEAAILAAKADLMITIERLIKGSGFNNTQTAEFLSVPRSRISELMNGKIEKISLDALTGWVSVLSKGQIKVGTIISSTAADSPKEAAIV